MKHEYSTSLIGVYKDFSPRKFEPQHRAWLFPWALYVPLVTKLATVPGVKVIALPVEVSDLFLKKTTGPTPQRVADLQTRIPPTMWERLLPFQREGVEYVVSHGGRALIADEMGLGKSLQALAGARYVDGVATTMTI